jgi:hypothetical protein
MLVVAGGGIATASFKSTTLLPALKVAIKADFKPTRLPSGYLAPTHLKVEGTIGMADGTHPPAIRKATVELDKNMAIDAKGLPACKLTRIISVDTAGALKACRPALVGKGQTETEVAFSGQAPFTVKGRVVAFYGGIRGGVRTIFLHSFLNTPTPTAAISTVKVTKIHKGRYGTKLVISIPIAAGSAGSTKKFTFDFFRTFVFKDEKRSFVSAKCTDGKLQARWEAKFAVGPTATGAYVRPCTSRN